MIWFDQVLSFSTKPVCCSFEQTKSHNSHDLTSDATCKISRVNEVIISYNRSMMYDKYNIFPMD